MTDQQNRTDADRLRSVESDIEILWILIGGLTEDQEKMKDRLRQARKAGASPAKLAEVVRRIARVETEEWRRD